MALVLALLCGALAVLTQPATAVRSEEDETEDEKGLLVLMVVTLNLGNHKFNTKEEFIAAFEPVLRGREEADVVVLSLQEVQHNPDHVLALGAWLWKGIQPTHLSNEFGSGFLCTKLGSHFNTALHVFFKDREPAHPKSMSVDQGTVTECGKAVNVLAFGMNKSTNAKSGKLFDLCLLNTHLSFQRTVKDRGDAIHKALDFVANSNTVCDALIYSGDFNSRLHCVPPGDHMQKSPMQTKPAWDMGDSTKTSFQALVDAFKTSSGSMSLADGHKKYADELNQLLDLERVKCYEKGTLVEFANSRSGLREVGPPTWPPSYKIAMIAPAYKNAKIAPETTKKDETWTKCFDNLGCISNPDQNPKHNPAWTDRILFKDSNVAKVTVRSYDSRQAKCNTDHRAVVAILQIGT